MKRQLLTMLAVLIALCGVPRLACLCNSEAVSANITSKQGFAEPAGSRRSQEDCERSCCSEDRQDAGPVVSKKHDCCGQMGATTTIVANSQDFLNQEIQPEVATPQPRMFKFLGATRKELIGIYNKAPPYIKAFGSSDTYLYKRVLLI